MLHFSRFKTALIWVVVISGILFASPNLLSSGFLNSLPVFFPKTFMVPGLDLQGGSHILLGVDRGSLIRDRLESARDEVRSSLRNNRIQYGNLVSSGRQIQLRILNSEKPEEAKKILESVLCLPISGGFPTLQGRESEFIADYRADGIWVYTLTESAIDHHMSAAIIRSISVMGRRVNELGTTEPVIQRQGKDRILVQVPGLQDPRRLKAILGRTARLTFHMVKDPPLSLAGIKKTLPVGTVVMYSRETPPRSYFVENRVALSGESLIDAQPSFDSTTGESVVSFRFDTAGAIKFARISQQNVGRSFAIVLDQEVISAPRIREPILGGSGQISGSFTPESANDLAILLRAGALPADLKIIEERTVGPSLGADSISAGKVASIVACILVASFMLLAYSTLGLIANIALVVNVSLIAASLSILGATLTMPGIAGIILTIGMAVDSNVIIYERIREEKASGKSLTHALDSGFARAMGTIVDSNFTTFIAAAILFFFGSGPIKGFAVTLAIGIATTVFTTFTFTRWMIAFWLHHIRPSIFPNGLLRFIPETPPQISFMRCRRYAFSLSAFISILTIVFFFLFQMNYGIDFKGGTSIEVQAKNGIADSSLVRMRLSQLDMGDVQVQKFGSDRELLIRLEGDNSHDENVTNVVEKARLALGNDYEFRRVESVGPTVSSELAWYGTMGLLFSLFSIFIYIWFRFEWQFSVGAIIATLHDVLMVIGLYIVSGFEFNLTSIAAILTIVGYSINDTVVVYDRVRENLRKYKKIPIDELIDLSINQTLSRTILTGITTLLALSSLYVFGGEVIRSFTFAMIFGILVGTYSSIFVAGPLLIFFKLRPSSLKELSENKYSPA